MSYRLIDRLNLRAYLANLDVVYNQPAIRAEDYLPLGNGDVGILIDPLGANCLGGNIVKSDVWAESHSNPEDPLSHYTSVHKLRALDTVRDADKLLRLAKYEEERCDYNRRLVRPRVIGEFRPELVYEGTTLNKIEELQDYEQRLSLVSARVDTHFLWRELNCYSRAFVSATRNLMVFSFLEDGSGDWNRRLLLSSPVEVGDEVSFGEKETTIWSDLRISNGPRVVVALRACNTPTRLIKSEHGYCYLEVSPKSKRTYHALLTVATSLDTHDPLREALLNLDEAESEGVEKLLSDHERWWIDFWRKSLVSLPDKDIEHLWFSQLYLLASSSRGSRPPGLCMLWPASDQWPWVGCYFDMNHALMYCSAESSNHGDLAEPYYRLYEGALPGARENARRLFGCRGAYYPHNMGADGYEISFLWWRLQLYHSALAALLFWYRWAFNADVEELKERIYPFMKEVGQFYQDYLEPASDGLYHFPGPNCTINEDNSLNVFRKVDPPFEVALVKRLMSLLLDASEILGVDAGMRPLWLEIVDHIVEPADNGEIFLSWRGEDPRSHMFTVTDTMGPIWPAQTVNSNDPRVLNTIVDAIASGSGSQCFSWMWIAAAAATAHMGYIAARCLHGQMARHQLPSGQMGESGGKGWVYIPQYERTLPGTLIGESGPAAVAAINQMLIHSLFDGIIEVFPAVSPSWRDCSFYNLRAMGGFLVSAAMSEGLTSFIILTSLRGRDATVRMPDGWRADQCMVRTYPDGMEVKHHLQDNIIMFKTLPGETYVILPAADSPIPDLLPLVSSNTYKLKYIGLPPRKEASSN